MDRNLVLDDGGGYGAECVYFNTGVKLAVLFLKKQARGIVQVRISLRIDHVLKSPRLTLFLVAETKLSLSSNLIWA